MIEDSAATVVFCDSERRSQVPDGIIAVDFESPEFQTWLDPGAIEPIHPRDDEAALILYTSGSTGRPKGVLLSHAAHLWVVHARMADDNLKGERMLIAAPLYHMNALANAFLACVSDATIVLLPQFQAKAYLAAHRKI